MKTKLPGPADLIAPYQITHGRSFVLADFDPGDTQGLSLKKESQDYLQQSIREISDLQAKLYANQCWSLLLIFQAMDAAGKDSVIKHVMSGLNPQGCDVSAFKQPSNEDLNHDFLWRTSKRLPERGRIGIFNRSYYEEVLIVRVHKNVLEAEHVPSPLLTRSLWKERLSDIANYEDYLSRNGTVIRKFFLNVSKEEQRKRFLARLDEPDKNWKFSEGDVHEREYWDDYMHAYEDAIRKTASKTAPWFVVPADQKWFTRMVVASAVLQTLKGLKLSYPRVNAKRRKSLDQARAWLLQSDH